MLKKVSDSFLNLIYSFSKKVLTVYLKVLCVVVYFTVLPIQVALDAGNLEPAYAMSQFAEESVDCFWNSTYNVLYKFFLKN